MSIIMRRAFSVRLKVLLVSFGLLLALLTVAELVLLQIVGPSFTQLERSRALDQVHLIAKTVRHEVEALDVLVQDWASWDDTYAYVETRDPDYERANLLEDTFVAADLSLILLQSMDEEVLWSAAYDLEEGAFIEAPSFRPGADLLVRLTETAWQAGVETGLRGLVSTAHGPMLIAIRPVLTSEDKGPPRGLLMMGRLLTDRMLGTIGDLLGCPIEDWPARSTDLPPGARTALEAGPMVPVARAAVDPEGGDQVMAASILLTDVFGDPLLVLGTRRPRSIEAVGHAALTTAIGLIAGAGVVLIAVFLWSQERLVLGPLKRLTRHIEAVGNDGGLSERLDLNRRDELGTVAEAFNSMQARVARFAYFDSVTGLPNRRLFEDRARQVLSMARRNQRKAAILFLDLDGFKAVNDSRGHSAGDALLRSVAAELNTLIRESDTVARFGGDEFVIVANDIDTAAQVADLSTRIQARFAHSFRTSVGSLFTSTSIGVAMFPDDGEDVESLIRKADAAMYQAKGEGGHRTAFLDVERHRAVEHLLDLEQAFREALRGDQLFLAFQPQYCLETGAVVAHEALLRWRHPVRGVLTAGAFIHLADRGGLFQALDSWVLRAGCRALAHGTTVDGQPIEHLAVNICARHLESHGLVGLIAGILRETGVQPRQLVVEITETVMVSRPVEATHVLSALRGLGVRVAIDDFGTGYASLAALHRFPADILKIDRAFIAGIPEDHAACAITRAILTLAETLGLTVIAEGIETEAQRAFLARAGCPVGQGFLWG